MPEAEAADRTIHIPPGLYTLESALRFLDAQKEQQELRDLIALYERVRDNLLYAPEIVDKKNALVGLTSELMGALDTAVQTDKSTDLIDVLETYHTSAAFKSSDNRLEEVFAAYQNAVNLPECQRYGHLLRKSKAEWGARDIRDACRAVSFISALREMKPGEKRDAALLAWGHDVMKAKTRKEGDGSYSADCYLVVEDPDKPSTWHLRVKDEDGRVNHNLMGAAWAALHEGYRGNRYEGPDREKALKRLVALYHSEDMPTPDEQKKSLSGGTTVKALGPKRVGAYAVLWGGPGRRDLTQEYFDRHTEDLDTIYKAVGALPYLYHHALDGVIKTRVIGKVDKLVRDEVGLWYEAQLSLADEYDEMVNRLIAENKLKSSSQTLASARVVSRDGRIVRWPIVEISATPTPAEPRISRVAEIKSFYDEIGCNGFECAVKDVEGNSAQQGAAKARLLLELQQLRCELDLQEQEL